MTVIGYTSEHSRGCPVSAVSAISKVVVWNTARIERLTPKPWIIETFDWLPYLWGWKKCDRLELPITTSVGAVVWRCVLLFCGIVYDLRADVGGCSDMHFRSKVAQ